MIKVLFVCLGNICRSPLAEGVFMKKVQERGLGASFSADSAGTSSYHTGSLPDPRSCKVARTYGIELTHRARAFTRTDFTAFDHIVAMDRQNKKDIHRLAPPVGGARVVLLGDYDHASPGNDVPDPYYGEDRHFEEVHAILERSCEALLNELLHSGNHSSVSSI